MRVIYVVGARTAQAIIDSGLSTAKSMVKDRLSGGGRRSGSSGGGQQVPSVVTEAITVSVLIQCCYQHPSLQDKDTVTPVLVETSHR